MPSKTAISGLTLWLLALVACSAPPPPPPSCPPPAWFGHPEVIRGAYGSPGAVPYTRFGFGEGASASEAVAAARAHLAASAPSPVGKRRRVETRGDRVELRQVEASGESGRAESSWLLSEAEVVQSESLCGGGHHFAAVRLDLRPAYRRLAELILGGPLQGKRAAGIYWQGRPWLVDSAIARDLERALVSKKAQGIGETTLSLSLEPTPQGGVLRSGEVSVALRPDDWARVLDHESLGYPVFQLSVARPSEEAPITQVRSGERHVLMAEAAYPSGNAMLVRVSPDGQVTVLDDGIAVQRRMTLPADTGLEVERTALTWKVAGTDSQRIIYALISGASFVPGRLVPPKGKKPMPWTPPRLDELMTWLDQSKDLSAISLGVTAVPE